MWPSCCETGLPRNRRRGTLWSARAALALAQSASLLPVISRFRACSPPPAPYSVPAATWAHRAPREERAPQWPPAAERAICLESTPPRVGRSERASSVLPLARLSRLRDKGPGGTQQRAAGRCERPQCQPARPEGQHSCLKNGVGSLSCYCGVRCGLECPGWGGGRAAIPLPLRAVTVDDCIHALLNSINVCK